MADDKQSEGRKANGAAPGGKPSPDTPETEVKKVGRRETETAGPDGPDAAVIGATFKSSPGAPSD